MWALCFVGSVAALCLSHGRKYWMVESHACGGALVHWKPDAWSLGLKIMHSPGSSSCCYGHCFGVLVICLLSVFVPYIVRWSSQLSSIWSVEFNLHWQEYLKNTLGFSVLSSQVCEEGFVHNHPAFKIIACCKWGFHLPLWMSSIRLYLLLMSLGNFTL